RVSADSKRRSDPGAGASRAPCQGFVAADKRANFEVHPGERGHSELPCWHVRMDAGRRAAGCASAAGGHLAKGDQQLDIALLFPSADELEGIRAAGPPLNRGVAAVEPVSRCGTPLCKIGAV